jgi:hypothetical protein
MTLREVGGALLRHAATVIVVLGIAWGVGRSLAEDFIEETVEERFEKLEEETEALGESNEALTRSIGDLTRSTEELIEGQEDETLQSQGEARALGEVLCRLRAEQDGRDPDECVR